MSGGVSGGMGGRLGDDLMLCNVSVANLPLQEVVPAAAAAGFTCMSVLARTHRRAVVRDGLSSADLRALLVGHGIRVQEVEAAGDWLGPLPAAEQPWLDPVYTTAEMLDLADELDARTVVATWFGASAPPERAAEVFAALCDDAADRGRQVALEFPAMATIADLGAAWAVVRAAGRANGGLLIDNWHHQRGGGSFDDLLTIPPDRIMSVQLSDADRDPLGPPLADIVRRTLPGAGALEPAGLVRLLDGHGVRCPVGIEVLRRDVVAGGATSAAQVLYDTLAATIREARCPT